MRFPVVKGEKTVYPSVALCPQCKKRKVFEPHSMVILHGGAVLLDRKRENSIHTRALLGFLNLVWHGAHDNGVGDDRDIGAVEIAADTEGGQFDMYFCSTACVRVFLNSCVDALEKCIVRERKKSRKSQTRLTREEKRLIDRMRKRGDWVDAPKPV